MTINNEEIILEYSKALPDFYPLFDKMLLNAARIEGFVDEVAAYLQSGKCTRTDDAINYLESLCGRCD